MKYLFLLILPFSVFGAEENCPDPLLPLMQPAVREAAAPLEWFAVADKAISTVPCKTKNPPSEKEMDELFSEKMKGPISDKVINGVSFTGESQGMLDLFTKLTSKMNFFGEPEKDQINIQEQYRINPECTKVSCALQKIWGDSLMLKLSYLYLKFGMNGSELAFKNADRYQEAELDDILIGLSDFPPAMMPIAKDNKQIIHFKRGYTLAIYSGGSNNTLANASVTFFDAWTEEKRPVRQYTVFHELGHNIAFANNYYDRNPEWLAMSGWEKRGDSWATTKKECDVSEYGISNPSEDFAETVSAYRFAAQRLKNRCPAKYNFMKNIFKGVEYLSEETCRRK